MKKVLMTLLTCAMLLTIPVTSVSAGSLDNLISGSETTTDSSASDNSNSSSSSSSSQASSSYVSADEYIADLQSATDLSSVDVAGADKVNEGIKKVAAFIIRIISYALTAFLVVRVLLDLLYIAIPFTRSFLSNGYAGNAAAGGGGMGPQGGMGMGGMGGMSGGFGGMGGMGMNRGYGMHGGMGGMGGSMGMQSQAGASPAMGRTQWVSSAALNAVAAESQPGPDGKPQSALKYYAKDMAVTLVLVPILLTLAITGALSDLGFLLGDVIAKGIASIGSMI
jgi:hypothetical protein